jgi:choline-glycine betaine transporter
MRRHLFRSRFSIASLLAVGFNLMVTCSAWAQVRVVDPPKPRYVMSYVLMFLMVGLGLMLICRPGKRSRDIQR